MKNKQEDEFLEKIESIVHVLRAGIIDEKQATKDVLFLLEQYKTHILNEVIEEIHTSVGFHTASGNEDVAKALIDLANHLKNK